MALNRWRLVSLACVSGPLRPQRGSYRHGGESAAIGVGRLHYSVGGGSVSQRRRGSVAQRRPVVLVVLAAVAV